MHHRKAFTLIELLVVIAIIAILSVVVILTLNPAQLLMQSRDANRFSDMASLNDVLGIYLTNSTTGSLGTASTTYISIADPLATSTAGDQCQGLSLPPLPTADSYHCAASSTYRMVNGTGWIPVNFSSLSSGSPLGSLPIDPVNTTSSGYYYTYTPAPNGSQYELTTIFESQKYIPTMANDGGAYDGLYQIGTDLNITPPFRSYGLVGYWPMDEASGSTAYDFSGNGNNGTWSGTQASPSSTYYTAGGLAYPYVGYFNGSNDYIGLPAISTLDNSTALTVSFWVNGSNWGSATYEGLVSKTDRTNGWEMEQQYGSHNILFEYFVGGSNVGNYFTSNTSFQNNAWYLVTLTASGNTVSLFVNGALDTAFTLTNTFSNSSNVLWIGRMRGATPWWTGQIDDVGVYNRVLSAAEIQALYNAEK